MFLSKARKASMQPKRGMFNTYNMDIKYDIINSDTSQKKDLKTCQRAVQPRLIAWE